MSATGRHVLRLSGYAPALPTPFDDAGELDLPALERLCHRQVESGATALVVCGTTGEASTLSRAEHASVVRAAVRASHGRIPVIAGAGSNSTGQAIELSRDAEAAGADAVLSVVPYYNKPTQAGMYAHFRAIAESTGLPIILHDVPARTVCGLADDTIARLAELPQFIGLKDATRRCRASAAPAVIGGVGVPIAVGRRCDGAGLLCAGRGRLYFRHLERNSGSLPRHVPGVDAGPDRSSAAARNGGREGDRRSPAGQRSGSGEVRIEHHGSRLASSPPAAG